MIALLSVIINIKTNTKQYLIYIPYPHIPDVKLIPDNIFDVQHVDPRFKNVKVVLVTPQDSRSGITNPVEYILHEGDGEYNI